MKILHKELFYHLCCSGANRNGVLLNLDDFSVEWSGPKNQQKYLSCV